MTVTEVDSVVRSVTVYQGRAMITREASASLGAGDHTLVFPGLPSDLDQDSLQVKGAGEAVLGECVFETEYFDEDVDRQAPPPPGEPSETLRRTGRTRPGAIPSRGGKAFLERISFLVTTPPAPPGPSPAQSANPLAALDVTLWTGMTGFFRERNKELDALRLKAERKIREIHGRIEGIDARIEDLGASGRRSRQVVKVGIRKKTVGDLTLRLSYMLPGPTWRPVYNLRAAGDSEIIALECDAYVSQATGEDWSGTELRLSTARVNVSGVIPELVPWRLEFYRPRPAVLRSSIVKEMAKSILREADDYACGSGLRPHPTRRRRPRSTDFEREEAEVRDSGRQCRFHRGGRRQRVRGQQGHPGGVWPGRELPAAFLYKAVPKLTEYAYLTARFKNDSDFPILPGTVNIFFDGSFVSSSAFGLVMPGQETDVSLGIDEGVKIEYRFIKRFRKNEGLVGKRISEQFEYQIRVSNNRSRPADIKISDQFPLSSDKDLVVKTLQPQVRDSLKDITLDDESRITWTFSLKPGKSGNFRWRTWSNTPWTAGSKVSRLHGRKRTSLEVPMIAPRHLALPLLHPRLPGGRRGAGGKTRRADLFRPLHGQDPNGFGFVLYIDPYAPGDYSEPADLVLVSSRPRRPQPGGPGQAQARRL
ncbi:MAG: mucoidy inhibitor MuiA family protein [Candidatus Moduliflexus flocculans]|nr:mucoidy inhibitor MuiA family protein [Candidatus Moduliflexus flocculans]